MERSRYIFISTTTNYNIAFLSILQIAVLEFGVSAFSERPPARVATGLPVRNKLYNQARAYWRK